MSAAQFSGSGIGPLPNGNATGISVQFNVSGMTHPLSHVSLKLGLTHTWVGDISARLTSPAGVATLVIFSRTGARRTVSSGFGDNSNVAGTYEFADDAGNDWYAVAAALGTDAAIPSGRYRTTTAGVPTDAIAAGTNHGGCSTSLKGAFNGLPAANANGVWTLQVADLASGDSGSVDSALLDVRDDDVFATNFDGRVAGSCTRALFDYSGSGRTSFALARSVGGSIEWNIKPNDGTLTLPVTTFNLGDPAQDYIVDGDWDGDGITDASVWRPGQPGVAKFIIRRSSRPAPLLEIVFGQDGDDPTHIGDFDGDGLSDAVVFRAASTGSNPAHTLIRPSSGAPDRDLVTGEDQTFANGGLDLTGDGVPDIAIQSHSGVNDGRFRIYSGVDGSIVRDFLQGFDSDFVIAGNVVGNSTYDVTTRRTVSGNREYTTRDMGTLALQPVVTWGIANDRSLSGDFDGDGLDDYAVWRGSAVVGQSAFIIRRSTDLGTLNFPMGEEKDVPPASTRVH